MSTIEYLKVFTGNCGGDGSPPIGQVIKDHNPHVLVVVEAKNARKHLKEVAENRGYRHFQPTKDNYGAEAPDIAVLIDRTIEVQNHDVMKMDEPWWYNGNKRKPRRYQRFDLEGGWRLEAAHFPPGGPGGGSKEHTGGKNGPAWKESRDATKRKFHKWYDNAPHDACLAVGDFNAEQPDMKKHLADPLDAYLTKFGKVNWALRKRAKEDWVKHLDAPTSNSHGWGVARFQHA